MIDILEQEVTEEYFIWLCKQIGFDRNNEKLLRYLFDREFNWVIDMDQNRALDGLRLRETFKTEEYVRGDILDNNPCTILEMLVALSLRIENEIVGDPDLCVFWRMIDNLKLTSSFEEEWNYILDDWMEREFNQDGNGSIFPLRHPYEDQRNVEIWGQAQAWLNELYS